MKKITFKENDTNLPLTMDQFEALTNEMVAQVNKLCDPHFLKGDYVAQVLMSAIHALDHKIGFVKKNELFAAVLNRISCHVTYHAVNEIQAALKEKELAEKAAGIEAGNAEAPSTDVLTTEAASVGQETH